MGGHDHHHDPYKIPDYRSFKVEDVPLLVATRRALAARGLSDPWLRNEVWRYNTKEFGTKSSRIYYSFFRGFKVGLAAFVVTMIATSTYDAMYPSEHGHGHSDDHGHH